MRKLPVVSRLEKHYRSISGELQVLLLQVVQAGPAGPELEERLSPQLREHRANLDAITRCLRLDDAGWTPDHLASKAPRRPRRGMDRGSLLSMAYNVLRETQEPITSSAILLQLWHKGLISREQAYDKDLRSALTTLLGGQEAVGAVRSFGTKRLKKWLIVRSSDPRHRE